ncbi:hypothetical protein ACSBR1_036728 [Camellia fascicularis]
MRFFLEDAEVRRESDKGVQTWVKQVKDVAYDTGYSCRAPSPVGIARGQWFLSLHKGYRYSWQLIARYHLAVQLQMWNDPRLASLFLDEAHVVGIDKHKSLLISWLVSRKQNLTTISVVGMGGVGKTTLVKKVHDSQAVKNYFNHNAWITVLQSFTVAKLLWAVLKDFLEETKEPIPEGIDMMGEIQLINMLKDYLQQKRYVIVFDDVWSINDWEVVKFALPDCCCGSRIVFITQIGDVAKSIETTSHVYQL